MSDRWLEFCASVHGLTREARRQRMLEYIRQNGPVGSAIKSVFQPNSQLEEASDSLAFELAICATPIVRQMLQRFGGNGNKLAWLNGVWIGGKRGMVLTVNDRSVLFCFAEGGLDRAEIERNAGASFNIRCLEFNHNLAL